MADWVIRSTGIRADRRDGAFIAECWWGGVAFWNGFDPNGNQLTTAEGHAVRFSGSQHAMHVVDREFPLVPE